MFGENIRQRVNFLLQAAFQSLKSNPDDLSLCRFYLCTLKAIARRQVIHLHHDIKRVICKRCCVLLVPGVTAMVRTRSKKQKQTVLTCLECGTVRRYHNNKNRIQWLDKEESWEILMEHGKMLQAGFNERRKGKNKQKQKQQEQIKQEQNQQTQKQQEKNQQEPQNKKQKHEHNPQELPDS